MSINVLSLFDGMSCGQIALNRANIKYDKYFASEIYEPAIKITQKNYPDTIQLGDVQNYKEWVLPKIDLLMGGSPCQGFSFAGKQLNFQDKRSKLFFEFVKILNKTKPKYFLLENVKMKKEYQDIISEYLETEPIEINSALVSAQNRKRLYWTNIPNICKPKNKKILLKDILENENKIDKKYYIENNKRLNYVNKKYQEFYNKFGYMPKMFNPYNCKEITDKAPTLTAQGASITKSSTVLISTKNGRRKLTPIEWERLQTVPDNYTGGVVDTHRYNMLGNGWTIDVIAHIFKYIENEMA